MHTVNNNLQIDGNKLLNAINNLLTMQKHFLNRNKWFPQVTTHCKQKGQQNSVIHESSQANGYHKSRQTNAYHTSQNVINKWQPRVTIKHHL